jgi:Tfp pilus assembly protein PilV
MPITCRPRHSKVHQKAHQKGLALIEVLLSLGLSSVMFLVLFSAQSHSQKVLMYSQQLHYANRLLDQVASQVWAYPKHYKSLVTASSQGDISCLNGRYCNPVAMTQAWATYWQLNLQQQLPNGELSALCNSGCGSGDTLAVRLRWSQSLAGESDQCQQGMACIYLEIVL